MGPKELPNAWNYVIAQYHTSAPLNMVPGRKPDTRSGESTYSEITDSQINQT